MKASELKVGDIVRWRNTGIGNGFMHMQLLQYHRVRHGLLRSVRDYWETRPMIEPHGYPELGTPYELSHWERKIDLNLLSWILSYGILESVHRDGKQIWPEVKG